MTAIEWLNEEGFKDTVLLKDTGYDYPVSILMERYANYCTRELEAKVLGFRNNLDNIDCTAGGSIVMCLPDAEHCLDLQTFYDKHFNLTTQRHGTTG